MKLRKWQEEATRSAYSQFTENERKYFVTEACTGAGKTTHGVEVSRQLMQNGKANFVIVVTPNIGTRRGWVKKFNKLATDLPSVKVVGDAKLFTTETNVFITTYQGYAKALKALEDAIAHRMCGAGVFSILDEYHHAEQDRTWGNAVKALTEPRTLNDIPLASMSLFLSGTPWRSNGYIAVLKDETNSKGLPYYDCETNRINADYTYTYADDLRSPTRATVPLTVTLIDAKYSDKNGKVLERLTKPKLEDSGPYRDAWFAVAGREAKADDYLTALPDDQYEELRRVERLAEKPMGKYFEIEDNQMRSGGYTNMTVTNIIKKAVELLDKSREEMRLLSKKVDATAMLIVAKEIKHAYWIGQYIEEVYNLKCVVVVSKDDEHSGKDADNLDKNVEAWEKLSSDRADVIISVGMVSEGVDIPSIKVVAYMSGILTFLYNIQTIGRMLRRIFVNEKPVDSNLHDMSAYLVTAAHPVMAKIALQLEQVGSDALASEKTFGSDRKPLEDPTPPADPSGAVVGSNGDTYTATHGFACMVQLLNAIEAIMADPRSDSEGLDHYWKEWLLGRGMQGNGSAERVKEILMTTCQNCGIDFSDVWMEEDAPISSAGDLSYESKVRLAKKQITSMVNRVRTKHSDFKDIEDDKIAFPRLRAIMNQAAGVTGIGGATLEQLDKMLAFLSEKEREVA